MNLDLSFLDPTHADQYKGFAGVMIVLALLFSALNFWRAFLNTERTLVKSLNPIQSVAYFAATGRVVEVNTPIYTPAFPVTFLGFASLFYVGMLLFGGELTLLWGFLFSFISQVLVGAGAAAVFYVKIQRLG